MKKSITITILFHLLFVVLAVLLVLYFQSASARTPVFSVSIAPNPVRSTMKVTALGGVQNEVLTMEIFDANGRVVYRGSIRVTGAKTVKMIPRPVAGVGLYYYRVIRKKTSQMVSGRIVFQ